MSGPYDDIISLPHPTSSRHPRMPISDRAAQFSPFAALAGHSAALAETARAAEEIVFPHQRHSVNKCRLVNVDESSLADVGETLYAYGVFHLFLGLRGSIREDSEIILYGKAIPA